jgi:ubiquinone/menaquinone biosynthesis C-methylase UbiE
MSIATAAKTGLDTARLEQMVKDMYRDVARNPAGEFHFEMGRALAERLGYAASVLDRVPAAAIESFAGVGYYFHLAKLKEGEAVVDLGSGSGMDCFVAALHVGPTGKVLGVDMTDAQLEKAERLRAAAGFAHLAYLKAYIERVSREDASFDAVISNGVINLAPDKQQVFNEAARLLRRGGRLAIADIVTEAQLPDGVTEKAALWAACIGGAMQVDKYLEAIERAGLRLKTIQDNPQYRFISDNAKSAVRKWGVKSISLLAIKE